MSRLGSKARHLRFGPAHVRFCQPPLMPNNFLWLLAAGKNRDECQISLKRANTACTEHAGTLPCFWSPLRADEFIVRSVDIDARRRTKLIVCLPSDQLAFTASYSLAHTAPSDDPDIASPHGFGSFVGVCAFGIICSTVRGGGSEAARDFHSTIC